MTKPTRLALSPEIDYQLDRLLEDWWLYQRDYRGGPAAVHASSLYARVQTPGHYTSAEEALADSVDPVNMEAVESSVASLPRQHQHAIDMRMLNSLTRVAVWRSNRITRDQAEVLYVEAKVMLLPMLRRRRVEI